MNVEQHIRERMFSIQNEIKVFRLLRLVNEELPNLPDGPSCYGKDKILTTIAISEYSDALMHLKDFLIHWNKDEIPQRLREIIK